MLKKFLMTVTVVLAFFAVSTPGKEIFGKEENEAITEKTVYEYNCLIGSKNTTLDVPVVPGTNYDVVVRFTGAEQFKDDPKARLIRIYYEDVLEDQCYANINAAYVAQGVDDRSALLYETPSYGEIDVREFTVAAIDDMLTIIVVGDAMLVDITVTPLERFETGDKPTVFIIGDSLVQTYNSSYYPMTGWGQMLSKYFTDDVKFQNAALGGRSTMNFIKQGRLNGVLTQVRPGDFVLVSFGTNDGGAVAGRAVTVTKFQDYLENYYIKGVLQRGGTPVMVTLANQNIISSEGRITQTYPAFVQATIDAAVNTNTPYYDLNADSRAYQKEMFDTIGIAGIKDIYYNAFRAGIYDNYITGAGDGTHYQTYGADKLAGFIGKGLKELNLKGLSEYYKAPEIYTEAPSQPTDIKFDMEKYKASYTHMYWTASEKVRYYRIEKSVFSENGNQSEWEKLGLSATNMFADPKRDESVVSAYRIIAVNEFGESAPSEEIYTGERPMPVITENDTDNTTDEAPDAIPSVPTTKAEPEHPYTWIVVAALIGIVIFLIVFEICLERRKESDTEEEE